MHRILDDPDTLYTCTARRRKITLLNKPENSTDFNVLDVLFSNITPFLQNVTHASTIDVPIDAARDAFHQSKSTTFHMAWTMLQSCM